MSDRIDEIGGSKRPIVLQPMSKCPWRSPAIPREPSVLAGAPPTPPLEAFGECLRDACALWKPVPFQIMTAQGPMQMRGMCSLRYMAECADPLAGAVQQLAALAMKLAERFGVMLETVKPAGSGPGGSSSQN